MVIKYAGVCEVGSVREINQDSIVMFSHGETGLFAVADGMGGHAEGEKASQQIMRDLSTWWENFTESKYDKDFRRMIFSLQQVIENANAVIKKEYGSEDICGSTVVLLFIYRNSYGILSVGDSRCYSFSNHKFKQSTIDDVWENQSSLSVIERKDRKNPNRGKLLCAVGAQEQIRCQVITDQIEKKICFLLCSDGLYKMVKEKHIKYWMKKGLQQDDPKGSCCRLQEEVIRNGARDNFSIVMVMA